MTVAELIVELQKLPQDLEVYFPTYQELLVDQPIHSVGVAPADFGQLVLFS